MSIRKKTAEQLELLQDALDQMPHIEEVHFTATGEHFFNKHELLDNGKGTGKFYGHLKHQLVPTTTQDKNTGQAIKAYKNASIAHPHTAIVETLTRDQVLSISPDDLEKEVRKQRGRPKKDQS